jgi:type IV secretion system protein VirB3
MSERNSGLVADVLFVAVTRPPMRWGVTYSALLFNAVFTMEVFLLTKNLLTLLIVAPLHGVCALLCARDARFFDLILLWGKTRMPAYFANFRVWKASSHGPLVLDPPSMVGRRRAVEAPQVVPPTLRSLNRGIGGGRSHQTFEI